MSVLMKIVFAAGVTIAIGIEPALAGDNVVCSKAAEQCSSGTIIIVPVISVDQMSMQIAKVCSFDKSIFVNPLASSFVCMRK